MTVTSPTSRVSYAGDGGTSAFPVSFKFLANADLVVVLVDDATGAETPWSLGSQYTLAGAGNPSGGTLNVSTAPIDYTPQPGETLVIYRDPDLTQGASLPLGGAFPSTVVERMADRLTMIAQRLSDLVSRSLRQPDGDVDSVNPLPPAISRANMYLAFDVDGNPIAAVAPEGGNVVSAFIATLLDDANAATARATLGATGTGGLWHNDQIEDSGSGNHGITLAKMRRGTGQSDGNAPFGRQPPLNLRIVPSVFANALTVELKVASSTTTDASSASPIVIPRRSEALNEGGPRYSTVTAALSLTVPSTATMGVSNGVPFRLWLVAISKVDATVHIGIINCVSGTNIYPLGKLGIATSVAVDTSADNAQVLYADEALASRPYSIIGYLEWSSGIATAGVWDTAPDIIELYGAGVPLPGQEIQQARIAIGAVVTGSTAMPSDDTKPQISEGVEVLTGAITPTSAANVLRIDANCMVANATSAATVGAALFDGGADALAAMQTATRTSGEAMPLPLSHEMLAAVTSSKTFSVRVGTSGGLTITLNGAAGSRLLGGVANSYLKMREIMA